MLLPDLYSLAERKHEVKIRPFHWLESVKSSSRDDEGKYVRDNQCQVKYRTFKPLNINSND